MTALALVRMSESPEWEDVCALDQVLPGTGVCALVAGRQVAVVRTKDAVYALGNFDPFSKAYVLSRGIVGDRAGVPKIASPIYKQSFDLRTGVCLDDPKVRLPVHEVRVERGRILVRCHPRSGGPVGD
ncbi:MAG TPA: nitrite reductase small subunit NirD [Myxococcales bacterium]|nr:nitrite reductase small subunit NirD [Myxococcales bacterium]